MSLYLSPEPLLQEPAHVRRMAETGLSLPTYAYALNNPIANFDEDGLRTKAPLRPRSPPTSPRTPAWPPRPGAPLPDGSVCQSHAGKVARTKFRFECGGDVFDVCITPGLNFKEECAECYANASVVASELRLECGTAAKKACDAAGCRAQGRQCP